MKLFEIIKNTFKNVKKSNDLPKEESFLEAEIRIANENNEKCQNYAEEAYSKQYVISFDIRLNSYRICDLITGNKYSCETFEDLVKIVETPRMYVETTNYSKTHKYFTKARGRLGVNCQRKRK